MDRVLDKGDVLLSTLVGVISIADIQNVISIIMLSIQVCYILFKFATSVYQNFKNNKIGEVKNDVKETMDELNKLKDELEKAKDGGKDAK